MLKTRRSDKSGCCENVWEVENNGDELLIDLLSSLNCNITNKMYHLNNQEKRSVDIIHHKQLSHVHAYKDVDILWVNNDIHI